MKNEWKARAKATEARIAPAVTKAEIEKELRKAFTEDCGLLRTTNAVWSLVSGDDPAVYVVRESDIAAVKVTEAGQFWRAGDTSIPLPWKANKVREKRDECAVEWVETEAIARAIESEQAVDPVEAKARELYRAATPDARWETVADEYRRIARHVLGGKNAD